MEPLILLALLLLATPVLVLIWLSVRAVDAKNRIEELSRKIDWLESEVARSKSKPQEPFAKNQPAEAPATAQTTSTPPLAPVNPVVPLPVPAISIWTPKPKPEIKPEFIAPVIPPRSPVLVPDEKTLQESVLEKAIVTPTGPAIPPPIPEMVSEKIPGQTPGKNSFEMQLGTFWLVRIGVVMLLTGLVFFGNYAYHNFIGKIGPAGKISLLYLVSGLLLGAGAWWQRRSEKASLKNFAQVVFAGGLAAVYFTTYAAHHIPPLCVITSPIVDGVLLLAWAGFMIGLADRKQSQVLALFSIALAYYTSVMTQVGAFTLYSNLVLTLAAVFFLVRNRWAGLSFASLVATYASYAFWRFYHGGEWRWATPDEGLWFGVYFLAAYWLVFTAAVFLSKDEKFSDSQRTGFLTLNNGAFFTLFLLTMLQVHSGGFWKFSLGCGAGLLALAVAAKRFLPINPLVKNAYLTQGLLLVTIGFIARFSGLHLSIVLGAESVVLFIFGTQRASWVLKTFAFTAAALATAWCVDSLKSFDNGGLWTGVGLGALLLFNAVWAHRQGKNADKNSPPLRVQPTWFTLLAFTNWLAATWFNSSGEYLPLALAAEALALTFSIYLLGVREITLLAQFILVFAQGTWLYHFQNATPPWWNPLVLIAITVGLSHWWQQQKILAIEKTANLFYQAIFALAAIALLFVWLHPLVGAPAWLALTGLLAVAATIYGVATRAWPLAIAGQLFLAVSAWEFFTQVWNNQPEWFFPLAPVLGFGILSFATIGWFARKPESSDAIRAPLLKIALVYRWIALAMSLFWIWEYVPERQHVWIFMAVAVVVFLFGFWKRNHAGSREILLAAAVYAATSLATLWAREDFVMDIYLPNALALLTLFALQQILRRASLKIPFAENIHAAIIFITGVSLWRFVSCWTATFTGGFLLTMSWAGLAVLIFATGIILRERFHRWLGLGVLAAAVGRVVLVDVWKQETIYRVLTFMALGVALLVMGFIYNKYQDAIRKWL